MENQKEILQKARQLLQNGWCQHSDSKWDPITRKNQYCMIGALGASSLNYLDVGRCLALLKETLQEEVNQQLISEYNDAPGRTLDEVLAIFDKTINKL